MRTTSPHRQRHPQNDAGRQTTNHCRVLFFLGHSTVVIVVSILIAVAASTLQQRFPDLIETAASAP
jgi:high-affinity nickel permease